MNALGLYICIAIIIAGLLIGSAINHCGKIIAEALREGYPKKSAVDALAELAELRGEHLLLLQAAERAYEHGITGAAGAVAGELMGFVDKYRARKKESERVRP